ncbi:MAG: cation transporter [Synechococcus sp.]
MDDIRHFRQTEYRSLRFGAVANAVMAMAGFVAHLLTGSSALLLDGLYSAVLVGTSLIATRISRNVVKPPDRGWPYGYDGQEAMYVLFRSLVLLGVIGFGLSSACGMLFEWSRGVATPPLTLEPVAAYTAGVSGLCWLLAWRHFRDWRCTGRISLLLLTEARNARIDALITTSTGLALLASPHMQLTSLAPLIPVIDPLLVLAISVFLLGEPVRALRDSFGQAAGQAANTVVLHSTREVLIQELSGLSLQMMDFTVQKLGRTAFVVVYINPLEPLDSATVDGLRHQIDVRCSIALQCPVRTEVILTVKPPIHWAEPEQQTAH